MNIAIFGGTFNPITKAHINIANTAINKFALAKLFFVPNHVSPFKKKQSVVYSSHRVNMIELVKPEKTEISLFEVNRKGVSYTVDTIRFFKQKFPEAKIYVLIGSDQLTKLNKWKGIDEIANDSQLVVFKRNSKFSKENIKKYQCILMNNEVFKGSSTAVRSGEYNLVEEVVNKYIGNHYLYIDEILRKMLDNRRHKHSYAVADLAVALAKKTGYDPKRAYIAGLLHDVTKCKTISWHREFLELQAIDDEVSNFQLHSLTGSLWVKNIYKLNDEEICNSILRHTSLAKELTLLDKIIYAADKLCEGRSYEGIQKDRELILNDFDLGFKNVTKKTYEFLISQKIDIGKKQLNIYKKWAL